MADQKGSPSLERRRETDHVAAQHLTEEEATSAAVDIESSLVSDSEVEKSLDALIDDDPAIHQLMEDSILEVDENTSEIDSHNQYILEQDDGLETEPDYFAAGTESQMSALLDQDSASLLLNEQNTPRELAEVIELEVHEKLPPASESPEDADRDTDQPLDELSSDQILSEMDTLSSSLTDDQPTTQTRPEEEAPFTFEKQYEATPPSRFRRYWALGCFILLLPLGGQVIWQSRDSLIQYDTGRQLLQGVCRIAGCNMPIRRATDKILISERTLTTHPDKENVLSLQLEMVNTAAFQQPYPKLQLSLYNDIGKLIARRTFSPSEYKATQYQSQDMMPKLQAIHAQLDLVDPGNDVTGFKFDFL
ncbi:MAG: DUF3426 domain-containing protein [Candidatus Thiodiazotropha sp. (ex Codakia rugifera)]|nr:DUF3426 domain-containing protein [Candidatus Thiodiazotropha sp. (ex Codakia rugifera)]